MLIYDRNHLEELDLGDNHITSLSNVSSLPALKTLILGKFML